MRVLIIGGSGLISTETARALLELGHDTTAVTRGQKAFRVESSKGARLKTVVADRQNSDALRRVADAVDPEVIIDQICYQPREMGELLRVRSHGLKQIVLVSTVCAFGGRLVEHPARAGTERRPISEYGRRKREIEDMLLEANRSGYVAGTIMRPSSTDGPGAFLSGNLWGRDATLFTLLKANRPIIVCAGGVLCQHGSAHDVGRAIALAAGRPKCYGKAYQAVGDECVTQGEWTRRTALALDCKEPNVFPIDSAWLCEKLKNWPRAGFLRDIWRYHCIFDNGELKRDIPEWRPEVAIADNARLTWEWAQESGAWAQAQAQSPAGFKTDLEPEALCEAYAKAKAKFLE